MLHRATRTLGSLVVDFAGTMVQDYKADEL